MAKNETRQNEREAADQFRAWPILLLFMVWMLLFCFPGTSLSQSASVSFQGRFELPQDPQALLEQILARDEFKQEQSRSLLDRVRDMVREIIRSILTWIIEHLPKGKWLDFDSATWDTTWNVLTVLLIGTALIVIVWFCTKVTRFFLVWLGRMPSDPPREAPEMEKSLVSREAYGLAMKNAEAGNYREGLTYLFRFALLWLDERGRLPLHPGKTNREVLQSLAPGEPLRTILVEMVLTFNRVKYGMARCDRDDYEHFLALCRTVEDTERQGKT